MRNGARQNVMFRSKAGDRPGYYYAAAHGYSTTGESFPTKKEAMDYAGWLEKRGIALADAPGLVGKGKIEVLVEDWGSRFRSKRFVVFWRRKHARTQKNPQNWPAGKYQVQVFDPVSRQLYIRTPKGPFTFFGVPFQRRNQIIAADERGDSDQIRFLLNLSGTYSDIVKANPARGRKRAARSNPRRRWIVRSGGIKGRWVQVEGPFESYEFPYPPGLLSDHRTPETAEKAAARYAKKWGFEHRKALARTNGPAKRKRVAHNPAACNNPGHAHRNPGLAGIMDKREAAKARSFA